jgi:hypothetical protein
MRRFLQVNTVFMLVSLLASQAAARTDVGFSGRTGFSGRVAIGTPRAFISRPVVARRTIAAQRFHAFNGARLRQRFLTGFPVSGVSGRIFGGQIRRLCRCPPLLTVPRKLNCNRRLSL